MFCKQCGSTLPENVQFCPNCGAPLEVNRSGQCEYCDSVIRDDSYGWILSNIRGISQITR